MDLRRRLRGDQGLSARLDVNPRFQTVATKQARRRVHHDHSSQRRSGHIVRLRHLERNLVILVTENSAATPNTEANVETTRSPDVASREWAGATLKL